MTTSTTFMFELRSSDPSERSVADALALAIFDAPPPWVGSDWTTKFEVTYVPSPRHKARGSTTTNPKRTRVLGEMAKPRPGDVIATGFSFSPPDGGDRTTSQHSLWSKWFLSDLTALDIGADGYTNPAMGPWALEHAATVLSLAPECRPSASWFGRYSRHPYLHDRIVPDTVPGYGWLVTMPSRLLHRLGSIDSSPAALSRVVPTPNGDEAAAFVLTAAPSEVTDELLREWRQYLRPVLNDNRLAERTAAFQRSAELFGVHHERPPMILADDWPVALT
ncbi:MAG: hypothetical protein RL238_2744 [Actinomycetota bacterium]|jgi:hypothetical protein